MFGFFFVRNKGGDTKAPVIIPIVGDRGFRGPPGGPGAPVSHKGLIELRG